MSRVVAKDQIEQWIADVVPGRLSDDERAILDAHYQAKFGWTLAEIAPPLDKQAGAKMPFLVDDKLSCWPYWWLMTDACFRSLIRLMGFTIRADYKWEEHGLFCLCERP